MKPLTLMAVHAHPDDESSSTGGVLAHYAARGVRTVVVTCTNGELGDAPGGIKPGEPGHDTDAVAAVRRAELEEACRILGVSDLELLGYHDSGMADWKYKDDGVAFCNVSIGDGAAKLAALFERYRPDVVVTYDDVGVYDHPDHLHAHAITVAAVEETKLPAKLYFTAWRRSNFETLRDRMAELGVEMPDAPEIDEATERAMAALEARITTTVDTSAVVAQKRAALAAHVSQTGESWFGAMPPDVFDAVFGIESFIRAYDTTGAPTPETELFAGLD